MQDEPEEIELHRALLFGVAYRMLGSVADAEDALQETRLRWNAARAERIESPRAWLVTVITRICLDQLKSARARREQYVGPWLPEPVFTPAEIDPHSISTAFLLLLERLAPAERAAFLLHDVFDYEHAEVARILGKSTVACRQLAARARRHLVAERPRPPADRAQHAAMLQAFATACASGDLAGLERLLAEEATMTSDGGGRVSAARNVVVGRDSVARFCIGIMRRYRQGFSFEIRDVNGLPAIVLRQGPRVVAITGVDVDGVHIRGVHAINNPDKLARLERELV